MTKIRHTIRVDEVDLEAWKLAAKKTGFSLSEWIRRQCNMVFFKQALDNTLEHYLGPEKGVPNDSKVEDAAGAGRIPVAKRRPRVARSPAGGVPVAEPVPRVSKTCAHGTTKGYRCWQCGGIAVIE